MSADDAPYLTLHEAAEYTRIKPETIKRYARDGKLAYIPTRPHVYVRTELDRLMQKLMVKPKRGARV